MTVIYRQEILHNITFLTSAPKAQFYDKLFLTLTCQIFPNPLPEQEETVFQKELCAFIVMKCECFHCITDLVDYLNNNLIVAHYCGFNIMKPLPSYWTFDRFICKLDNAFLKKLMQSQVLKLSKIGIIDTSFIALDSTFVNANTRQNNPKSFAKNKFSKNNQPKSDKDCSLGVHTALNQHNEHNFEYYWGYKNHILVDCITGLPIYELTTSADISDSTVALDILSQTNSFLSVDECTFLVDNGYDVKVIYNTVKELLSAEKQQVCLRPCNHKNLDNDKKHRGCNKYVTLPDDYRLSIDRECISFKKLYALRTETERYNSRFKQTR